MKKTIKIGPGLTIHQAKEIAQQLRNQGQHATWVSSAQCPVTYRVEFIITDRYCYPCKVLITNLKPAL